MYVYIVYSFEGVFHCFSSLKKAKDYCYRQGCKNLEYETKFTFEYLDNSGNSLTIYKTFVR